MIFLTSRSTCKKSKKFSAEEREKVVDIALQYRSKIENKKTDSISAVEKSKAWEDIACEFNASGVARCNRTGIQLKTFYRNQKSNLKKNLPSGVFGMHISEFPNDAIAFETRRITLQIVVCCTPNKSPVTI